MFKRNTRTFDKQFDNPLNFRPGVSIGPDEGGQPSVRISKVFYRTADYAIFELEGSQPPGVEYFTIDDRKFNTHAIAVQLTRINGVLENSHVAREDGALLASYEEAIADAIQLCFEGRGDEAGQRMTLLETAAKNEVYKYSKVLYLLPCMLLSFILVSTSATWYYIGGCYPVFWNRGWAGCDSFSHLLVMAALATIGSIVSMSNSLDQRQIEIKWRGGYIQSLFPLHPALFGGIIRLVAGIAGALIIEFFFKSKLLVIAGLDTRNDYLLYLLAFAAGFSEQLIPSLLTQFESRLGASEPIRVNTGSRTQKLETGQLPLAPLNPTIETGDSSSNLEADLDPKNRPQPTADQNQTDIGNSSEAVG